MSDTDPQWAVPLTPLTLTLGEMALAAILDGATDEQEKALEDVLCEMLKEPFPMSAATKESYARRLVAARGR